MRERVARAALLAATFLLSIVPSAWGSFPGQNGKIAFTGTDGVYTINLDGSGRTLVAAGSAFPAWSADGGRLTYFGYEPVSANGLNVANADGSGPVRIRAATNSSTPTSGITEVFEEPAWAPDGSTIAYEAVRYACSHPSCIIMSQGVRAINPDGSGDHSLPLQGFPARNPAYSPDGSQIAWDTGYVHVSQSDGTGDTVLGGGFDPSWSPDGTRIAFAGYVGCCNPEIQVMNADGSGVQRLTFDSGWDTEPAWSPDGTKIVWTHGIDLWVMNADGSEQARLTAGSTPDWQPLVGPRRTDYKNASHFCKAEREFLGAEEFAQKYGSHGGCVSGQRR